LETAKEDMNNKKESLEMSERKDGNKAERQ
jgi:hypothetical protein